MSTTLINPELSDSPRSAIRAGIAAEIGGLVFNTCDLVEPNFADSYTQLENGEFLGQKHLKIYCVSRDEQLVPVALQKLKVHPTALFFDPINVTTRKGKIKTYEAGHIASISDENNIRQIGKTVVHKSIDSEEQSRQWELGFYEFTETPILIPLRRSLWWLPQNNSEQQFEANNRANRIGPASMYHGLDLSSFIDISARLLEGHLS